MYSFEIEFNRIKRDNILYCHRAIYVSGICIVAKNDKFGNFYFSKYIKKRIGNFLNVCGSNQYPELCPAKNKVTLYIHNFPKFPTLNNPYEKSLGDSGWEFIEHIKIKNICDEKTF